MGAQGSAIAKRLNEHPGISEIICDEPVTMGLLADKVLKGVKNVDFKYGGSGVELAEVLYKMGLLATDVVTVKDTRIVPMDLVLTLCPPAPKYPEEIKAIIDEGAILEEGAFLVRVDDTGKFNLQLPCFKTLL